MNNFLSLFHSILKDDRDGFQHNLKTSKIMLLMNVNIDEGSITKTHIKQKLWLLQERPCEEKSKRR